VDDLSDIEIPDRAQCLVGLAIDGVCVLLLLLMLPLLGF
jgi:hypothetical protein